MPDQAPNIDIRPGTGGRLVYDKARRVIVAQQKVEAHPLAPFGYRRPPNRLWGVSPRLFMFVGAVQDIWLIATGRITLHRAWQAGHDHGHAAEVGRQMRGGR